MVMIVDDFFLMILIFNIFTWNFISFGKLNRKLNIREREIKNQTVRNTRKTVCGAAQCKAQQNTTDFIWTDFNGKHTYSNEWIQICWKSKPVILNIVTIIHDGRKQTEVECMHLDLGFLRFFPFVSFHTIFGPVATSVIAAIVPHSAIVRYMERMTPCATDANQNQYHISRTCFANVQYYWRMALVCADDCLCWLYLKEFVLCCCCCCAFYNRSVFLCVELIWSFEGEVCVCSQFIRWYSCEILSFMCAVCTMLWFRTISL